MRSLMAIAPPDQPTPANSPEAITRGLARWQGAVDEVVLRAITAKDTVEDHLALVRAAAPA